VGGGIRLAGPLLTEEQIEQRVRTLAATIDHDYQQSNRPLSVITVLKGGCFFSIDLLRRLKVPIRLDFVQASSYSGMSSTGEVILHKDISMPIADTDVLLVEDIVDTGLTVSWLLRHLASHNPTSVRLCALLDKPARRTVPVTIDYLGFTIPDAFVLGYGLDYEEQYRNLPAIYVAEPID
jgi:hypoxanthine phosphoribosyltransferase